MYRVMKENGWLHKKRIPHGITKTTTEAQEQENLLKRDFSADVYKRQAQHLGSMGGDNHQIFNPNAALPRKIYPRFYGKNHSFL